MRVAITGAAGLLGCGAQQVFSQRHEVLPLAHCDMDITNAAQVLATLQQLRPDVVLHTAAIPDPDVCEREPERAYAVNAGGTQNVVEGAARVGAIVAHISTDAVFDGTKGSPYVEEDERNPISVYGRTKLEAERIVQHAKDYYIFRVSVLFGPGKDNFVSKGLRKLAAGEEYVVASDQVGCATYTIDAAEVMLRVIESQRFGLYHVANAGICSRLELAIRAAEVAGVDAKRVIGRPLADMKRDGPRTKYAVMDMVALRRNGFGMPRGWQQALQEYISTYECP